MTIVNLERRIRNKFSSASRRYEEFFGLQREIGLKLLARIDNRAGDAKILDIGMGTGWLTKKLKQRYPRAIVFGLDFAPGMVEQAQRKNSGMHIVQADACALPFKDHNFDIAFSNLTYQWIENLPQAFSAVSRVLKGEGVFYFSCFGKKTLNELFAALNYCTYKDGSDKPFTNDRLAEKETVDDALRRVGFRDIKIDTEVITIYFKDTFALIRWLKNTGANAIQHDIFIGRDLLVRADDFYKRNFSANGNIYASFELILGEARK